MTRKESPHLAPSALDSFSWHVTWAVGPGFYIRRLQRPTHAHDVSAKRLGNMLVNDQPPPSAFLPDGCVAAIELERSPVLLFG